MSGRGPENGDGPLPLEIELKWDADGLPWERFVAYFESLKPTHKVESIDVIGPDQYWRLGTDAPGVAERIASVLFKGKRGPNFESLKWRVRKVLRGAGLGASVVRYRKSPNIHQLTVKRRTSDKSTKVREEADIEFLRSVPQKNIESFLALAGYARDFTLVKHCQIYWVTTEHGVAVPVIYDIHREDRPGQVRRFVEVEAEKGQPQDVCERVLDYWSGVFAREFGLTDEKRNHLSLYEIYSGRRYIGA